VAEKYVSWAEAAIRKGQYTKAENNLKKLGQVNPKHSKLAQLRQDLKTKKEERQQQVARERQRTTEKSQQQTTGARQRAEKEHQRQAELERQRQAELERQEAEKEKKPIKVIGAF